MEDRCPYWGLKGGGGTYRGKASDVQHGPLRPQATGRKEAHGGRTLGHEGHEMQVVPAGVTPTGPPFLGCGVQPEIGSKQPGQQVAGAQRSGQWTVLAGGVPRGSGAGGQEKAAGRRRGWGCGWGWGSSQPSAHTREPEPRPGSRPHRVPLEGLHGAVAAEPAHVDAHVGAAGGEGGVALPVHVERGGCGQDTRGASAPTGVC